jgi:hypothetical protein
MARRANILAVLTFAMALPASGAETYVQRQDPSTLCHNEDTTITIWHSQNTVLSLDYDRRPAVVTVDARRWLRLPANVQASIALSAYCRLHAADATADLEVRGGSLYGTVSRGEWHNWLTGN